MRKQPGVALVGYGGIALEHMGALHAMGARVALVVGPDEQRAGAFATEHAIPRWSTRFEDVLGAADVDAVVITSPNDVHAEQTIACVESGKHVLCEVPVATSLADAERVAELTRSAGTVSMVCQTERFFDAIAKLRSGVVDGVIDPLHLVSLMGMRRRHDHNFGWTGRQRRWVDNLIWHHGSHAVDTALWLFDDAAGEVCAATGRGEPIDHIPVDVSIALRTSSGRLASLSLSYSAMRPVTELFLIAEGDSYMVKDLIFSQVAEPAPDPARVAQALSVAVLAQDRLFVDSVRGQAMPSPTPTDLLGRCRVLHEVDLRVATLLDGKDRRT